MSTVSIEGILYSNYIKYDRIQALVSASALSNSSSDKINIFIDINSMILPIYRYHNITYSDYSCLCSIIINMCAHYRHYFRQRHRVESDIYLVYSRNVPDSCKSFIKDYNIKTSIVHNARKDISKFIEDNLNILTALCPFIPNIYIVRDDSAESAVLIRSIYETINELSVPNLIISKDPYMYTLASINEAIVFRPSKYNGEDSSFFIDKLTVWDTYRTSINIKNDYKTFLNTELFPFILALSSASFRGLKSILNFNKAIKLTEQGISNNIILNSYIEDAEYSINSLSRLYDSLKINHINSHDIVSRYKAINPVYQSSLYKMNPNYSLISSIKVDLFDPESVKKISELYFKNNPLDLNRL